MAKYRIISNKKVCGFAPDSIVDDADLVDGDVAHLIQSGHIAPVKSVKRSDPADNVESQDEVN